MSQQKKQSIVGGAMILSLAIIAVKFIGVFFKLYVAYKIGYDGKGYYSTAYNIYTPIYQIALAGLPVAVSKMVASLSAEGRLKDLKRLFSVSNRLFALLGAAGTLLMLALAIPLAKFMAAENAIPAIVAIAPSIFFCCVMSGYRGYYQGLGNMTPTSVSQVIEAAGKLIVGFVLVNAVALYGVDFADSIPILRDYVTDAGQAYAAAGAIVGVTVGGLMGLIYLIIRHRIKKNDFSIELIENSPDAVERKILRRELFVIAIPIMISALVGNITTLIDNLTIQNRLQAALDNGYDTVAAMYPGIVEAKGYTAEMTDVFKSYLFGAYDTVLEIKNIVPTFTITLGLSAIPVLTAAWKTKDKANVQRAVDSVTRITMLLGMPAGFGMIALAEDILFLLYGTSENNAPAIPYIAPTLMLYGFSVFFLALMNPIANMLQAVDKLKAPIWLMAIGGVVKAIVNLVLVGIPAINIQGAVIGSLLCNIIYVVGGYIILKRGTGITLNAKKLFIKPTVCAFMSGAAAWAVSYFYKPLLPEAGLGGILSGRNICTVCAVFTAVVVYVWALFITDTVTNEDITALPGDRKIARVLTKTGLIR